jgi:hypothetical protein
MKYTSLIEKYLLGELENDSLTEFINSLKSDPELQEEFNNYQNILKFINDNELNIEKIIKNLTEFELNLSIIEDLRKYRTKSPYTDDEKDLSEKILKARQKRKSSEDDNTFK